MIVDLSLISLSKRLNYTRDRLFERLGLDVEDLHDEIKKLGYNYIENDETKISFLKKKPKIIAFVYLTESKHIRNKIERHFYAYRQDPTFN